MEKPWRVLLVEDSATDEKLLLRELRRGGRTVDSQRVQDAPAMRQALAGGPWDVVISDWTMPRFSAKEALDVLKTSALDLPFIIVTGTVGEEAAVDAMRAGAKDYVLKANLGRLIPAIERELRESAERVAVREREVRSAAIVRCSIDPIVATDHTGRVIEFNPAAERCFGYSRTEALGQFLSDLIIPERFREQFRGRLAASLSETQDALIGQPLELLAKRKDGTEFPIERRLTRLDTQSPPILMGFIRDLSAHAKAEAALRQAQARFTRLFESGLVGIVIGESTGRIVEANDAFLSMVGYSREDLAAGRVSWANMTPPEWVSSNAAATEQLRLHGIAKTWEKEYLRKDGGRIPVLVGVASLEGKQNISLSIDLSARREAEGARTRAEEALRQSELQLRQAQKMEAIGSLAGGVAHDFNNLLSVILTYSEMLLSEIPATDPAREDLEEIKKAGQRAAALTRQLLLFSRQQVTQPKVLDLNEVLSGMDKMVRRLIGEDIEFASVLSQSLGQVFVDPSNMDQVIMNLIVNARDAMPRGGKLTLETADVSLDETYAAQHLGVKPGNYVMLAVSDTGTGMDEATQARIFEPFFTTKERGKGTGLGLSTVFGIVQQSEGCIWVYSELGKGTTFKIYLPRADGMTERAEPAKVVRSLRGTETILLVEDEDTVRKVAFSVLRRHGYRVLEARNAGEALLICEKEGERIDLLLSDVVMPQMSGPEVAKRIAQTRPGIKVLCMSGYTDETVFRHGILEAGIAFIQKPITPESLLSKVREVLDGPPPAERA
jgi:two-component system cell cycle sensor histidine kinase/response regulator CckA